jgi:hypothetical protein
VPLQFGLSWLRRLCFQFLRAFPEIFRRFEKLKSAGIIKRKTIR